MIAGCTVRARLARYSRRVNSQVPVETTRLRFCVCARVRGGDSAETRFTERALRIHFAAGPRVSAKTQSRSLQAHCGFRLSDRVRRAPVCVLALDARPGESPISARSQALERADGRCAGGRAFLNFLRGGARIRVTARRDYDAPLVSRARGRARPPLSCATGAALDAERRASGARAALGGGPRRRRTKRKDSRVFTRFFYQHFYLCRNIGKF